MNTKRIFFTLILFIIFTIGRISYLYKFFSLFSFGIHPAEINNGIRCSISKRPSTAILFLCHIINPESIKRFFKLISDTSSLNCAVIWCLDNESSSYQNYNILEQLEFKIFSFSYTALDKDFFLMKDPRLKDLFAGNHLFPLISFAQKYKYLNYWLLEFDVVYKGSWKKIFSQDFNTSTIIVPVIPGRMSTESKWPWIQRVPKNNTFHYYASMIHIVRVSYEFIILLGQKYQEQGKNHPYHVEVFFPSVLLNYSDHFHFKEINSKKILVFNDYELIRKIYHNQTLEDWLLHPYKLSDPI